MQSRSWGLGVHRPSTTARTRCSSTPACSANCLASIPRSAQSCATPSGLPLRPMPPGDLTRDDPQRGGQPLAPLRAGRVAATGDRLDHPPIQPRGLDQFRQADTPLRHPAGECLHLRHANHPFWDAGRLAFVPRSFGSAGQDTAQIAARICSNGFRARRLSAGRVFDSG
jgi:hypothetical protein